METRSAQMPTLFIGHGSPMNAIAENSYTNRLKELGQKLPTPKAILCISAHWMTEGTWVTNMPNPKTIHDFRGFPSELFAFQYPAPGSPEVAARIQTIVKTPTIRLDDNSWGLDHGSWAVLCHLFPKADIPTVQLSLSIKEPASYHYQLGESLRQLRQEGILIVGSGNIVHNLRTIRWEEDAEPFDWAVTFDAWVKRNLERRQFTALVSEATHSREGQMSIPTPEHWYPLLYVIGASKPKDSLQFEYEGIQNGSISMLSVSFS